MIISNGSTVLMIKPVRFGFNTETSATNTFQQAAISDTGALQEAALKEFNALADLLRSESVNVMVIEDTVQPHKPDSIFPNNWVSFHENGTMVLYPMLAPNRRHERRDDIITTIRKDFECTRIIDLTINERKKKYLEGTGSVVFDYDNGIAYASRSPRTDEQLISELCAKLGYAPVIFTATDRNGVPLYHTNVMLCIAEKFAIVCLDSIGSEKEKNKVKTSLESTGKDIITITREQVENFAGNMYELNANTTDPMLLMSSQAAASLDHEQKRTIEKYCRIIHSPLDTIEKFGGGSARCMIADIRLPRTVG